MPDKTWDIRGDYMETCSCEYLCPCITFNATTPATEEFCRVTMTFQIEQGHFADTSLDGLIFAVIAESPPIMSEGNWAVGVIVTDRASEDQANAIQAIASGEAGGPMTAFAPLIGDFRGLEIRPFSYEKGPMSRSARVPELLDHAVEGIPSTSVEDETIVIDNTFHPANKRLSLAKATRSHMHAFGIHWDDDSGKRNGHYAPFHWSGTIPAI